MRCAADWRRAIERDVGDAALLFGRRDVRERELVRDLREWIARAELGAEDQGRVVIWLEHERDVLGLAHAAEPGDHGRRADAVRHLLEVAGLPNAGKITLWDQTNAQPSRSEFKEMVFQPPPSGILVRSSCNAESIAIHEQASTA
jgi:hypothetical protein